MQILERIAVVRLDSFDEESESLCWPFPSSHFSAIVFSDAPELIGVTKI
jgi:hypothetical protein